MKFRHVMWILAAADAVVSMAAGVAVFVSRYLNRGKETDYIECECDSDPISEEPEAEE